MVRDAFSKCHPAVNFIFFALAIGFGVVIQHPLYILSGMLCAGTYYLALRGRRGLKLIFGLLPVFVFLSAINPLFNTNGEHVLFTLFGRPYTREALMYGMVIAGVFLVMTLWFGCYSIVLTSDKFVCLFGSIIPALSLLLVMVLRLIPNLLRKGRQIVGVRKSIGKGISEENTRREKLRGAMVMLSALTDWALEGSIVTADSMRSRGYGSARRSSFQIYRMRALDWLLLAAMALLAAAVLILGGTGADFTPTLRLDRPGAGLAAYILLLLIPIFIQIKETIQWHISSSGI